MFESMAAFWYGEHYRNKIAPSLTIEQKREIATRISDITLYEPFSTASVEHGGRDYTKRFPELAALVNVPISGLYLVAILEGLVADLREAKQ